MEMLPNVNGWAIFHLLEYFKENNLIPDKKVYDRLEELVKPTEKIICPKCKYDSTLKENHSPNECELIMSETMNVPLQMYVCNNTVCKLMFLIDDAHK